MRPAHWTPCRRRTRRNSSVSWGGGGRRGEWYIHLNSIVRMLVSTRRIVGRPLLPPATHAIPDPAEILQPPMLPHPPAMPRLPLLRRPTSTMEGTCVMSRVIICTARTRLSTTLSGGAPRVKCYVIHLSLAPRSIAPPGAAVSAAAAAPPPDVDDAERYVHFVVSFS